MKHSKLEELKHRELESYTYRELESQTKTKKIRIYPKLYKANETYFYHNGLGLLADSISCLVTEELNGEFSLELEYALQDKNGLANQLIRGNLIKVPVGDSREPQLFRIRKVTKGINSIKVYAEHIAIADLGANFIKDTNIVGKTRIEALEQILANCLNEHKFTCEGTGNEINNLRIVRYSPLKAILGNEDNTLLNRYSGEIELDNYNIKILDNRGKNNGVLITYRKNITGVNLVIDDMDMITRAVPMGNNGLLLDEYYIDSPKINDYEQIYTKVVEFNDIGVVEEGDNLVTEEEAKNNLKIAMLNSFKNDSIDIPKFDLNVDMVDISNTVEYQDYSPLEAVAIGDTIKVTHKLLGLNLSGRIYKKTYDVLQGMNTSISIGFKSKTLSNMFDEANKTVSSAINGISKVEDIVSNANIDVSAIKGELVTINSKVRELNSTIETLEYNTLQNTLDIESNALKISTLSDNVNATLGDIESLNTTNKDNIVSAINELYSLIKDLENKENLSYDK